MHSDFAGYIATSGVSFFLGMFVKMGVLRFQGRSYRLPIIERSRAAFTGLVILMLSLSLVTIVQLQGVINRTEADGVRTEECNRGFRDAINFNQQLTDRLRPVTAEQDAQLERRRAAIDKLVDDLISKPITAEQSRQALMEYQSTVADVNTRRAELAKQRADIIAQRSVYPDPKCGR